MRNRPAVAMLLCLGTCVTPATLVLTEGVAAAAPDAGLICQENPCTTDAECGAGMRCQANAVTACDTSEDGGTQACAPATLCEPIWDTTCSQDSDCGDGFSCASSGQTCDCGGDSTGIDIPDSAVSTPCSAIGPTPPPELCDDGGACPGLPTVCNDGGSCLCWETKICQQNATPACATSADCPSLFTCASGACQPPCSNLEVFGGSAGGGTAPTTGTPQTSNDAAVATGASDESSSTTSSGGCTVEPGSTSARGEGVSTLVALGLAFAASRRRRRAAQ